MGGTSSTTQIREQIMDTTTNIVNESLTSISNSTTQNASMQQVIRKVTVLPTPRSECPAWAPPGPIALTNRAEISLGAFTSLAALNASQLSDKMADKINNAYTALVNKEKDGTLAITDSTRNYQHEIINARTRVDLRNRIETRLKAWKKQQANVDQVMSEIVVPQPCGNVPTTLTNEGLVTMVSKDLASVATDTVMESDRMRELTSAMASEDKQKARDVFSQLESVINNALDKIGMIGMGAVVTGALAVLFIPLVLFALSRFFGGGGGGSVQIGGKKGLKVGMAKKKGTK